MSTITPKEKNMLMVTLVLVLYGAAALFYRGQKTNWAKQERIYKNAQKKFQNECDLIAAKTEWDEKYRKMCSLMPIFPYDKDVDTHWLNIMDTVASEKSLGISRRQTGKEEEVGDVYELPIECKNWEGTLESLVTFLYGLRQEGAMVDVRQLYVRPAANPGYLKGTFSLHCAYMRGDVEVVEVVEVVEEVETIEELDVPTVVERDESAEAENEKNLNPVQPEVDEEEAVKAALKTLSGDSP
ncbi:MAG: hypothetical protein PF904_07430 [Kiritimatiellae bacterium]|jgi:hypothetical protein|nr:hypothetical protein [Kiritimatiellia bacterium]